MKDNCLSCYYNIQNPDDEMLKVRCTFYGYINKENYNNHYPICKHYKRSEVIDGFESAKV